MQVCPNCGEENPDRFRLCGMCGTELSAPAAPEVRKTVTIVFSDLKGSTSLAERLDPESLREVLNVYFEEMRAVLEHHGGTVEKYIGDAIMAVFGLPILHEDDAMRAVRAAFEMQAALTRVNERLRASHGVTLENRTGVNTGDVVAGDVSAGQRLVTGDAVNVAARLEQNAPAMQVLIGGSTYRLVRDAVEVEQVEPLELKGKSERMPAYLLRSASPTEGLARRVDTPIVGRDAELAHLARLLDEARDTTSCRIATIVAPAGAGKSRLLHEFVTRSGDGVASVRGRCLSYGDGITFWPVTEITHQVADIENDDLHDVAMDKLRSVLGREHEDVLDRLASTIGLSATPFAVEESFWAVRRLFEILARDRPLIVVIDDIHWAEQTLLQMLEYLANSIEGAAVVIVCSARTDLLEARADWGAEHPSMSFLRLEALSDAESALIVEHLLGDAGIDEAARTRVVEAAQGNPLFVEQMLSMLVDDGILSRGSDGWVLTTTDAAIKVPPTISALLTARLDRLRPSERGVIERGAVMGQVFFRGAVEALAPDPDPQEIGQSLSGLVRKELIAPHESTFAGQDAFAFVHILIRDAAYHAVLKRTRADLHERFVDWMEEVAPDRGHEFEEIHGYHLEQAYLTLVQLAATGDHLVALGRRGAAYLGAAGSRATARGDMPAAASLLQRAAGLLPPGDRERPHRFLEAADALIETGDFIVADGLLQAARDEAVALGDTALQLTIRLALLRLRYTMDPGATEPVIRREAAAAIRQLEMLEANEGLARAWRMLIQVNFTACRWGAVEDAAEKMVTYARLAGDETLETRFLASQAMAALYGPMPVQEADARCDTLLTRASDDRRTAAILLCVRAHLAAMRGGFEEARSLYRKSRAILEELGWRFHAALTSLDSGAVEMLAGDPVAAEAELRGDLETLTAMGDRDYMPTTAAMLAEALFQQGRLDEARSFATLSRDAASSDDVTSQFLWRCVLAKVTVAEDPEAALVLAREAVELTRATEEPDSQGLALLDLAQVLVATDREAEALPALREAIERFDAKGNLVSAERASAMLDEVASGAGAATGPG